MLSPGHGLAPATRADVVLVGGGLANGLIVVRLKALRPALKVIVAEKDAIPGGRHTWSHFASDVSEETGAWPAVVMLERFHRLSQPLVEWFYAGRLGAELADGQQGQHWPEALARRQQGVARRLGQPARAPGAVRSQFRRPVIHGGSALLDEGDVVVHAPRRC